MAGQTLRGMATRRDVIKGALKTGAYIAPVIAAGVIPMAVGAVTPAPTMMPTMTPVPVGPAVFVAPTSGGTGVLFAVAGSRFPANTSLEVRLIAAPTGITLGTVFSRVSSSATGTFFINLDGNTRVGTFVFAVEPVGTTNVLAQFTVVVTTGTLPLAPVLTANPTSGPVGTNFAFNASGLTPFGSYNLRAISAPPSDPINGTSVSVQANPLGQIAFSLDTSTNAAVGTYVIGITNAANTTILAQASVVTTSMTGLAVPRAGSASALITAGPSFTIG